MINVIYNAPVLVLKASSKTSATKSSLCMCCFSVYLGKAAGTRAALPRPTSVCVCGILVFTWVRQQQPQEQCYSVLPMCVCGVLVFTWIRLQQPQEWCYPVLPVCVVF